MKTIFAFAFMTVFCLGSARAQEEEIKAVDTSEIKILVTTPRRFYTGNGYDFLMLSAATFEKPGKDQKITTPRFTAVVNIGLNFHYDLNKRFGLFTGISLKNLGFIEKNAYQIAGEEITIKRRVYTLGVPLGVKLGDLRNRNFVFAGGGLDVPLNYREKRFTDRQRKFYKDSEWFSDQTATVLPYVFLGVSIDPGMIIKAQYYPSNFFNEDYETNVSGTTVRPYAGYNANIFSLSFSMDIHYNQYKIQEREYRKWKREQSELKTKTSQ